MTLYILVLQLLLLLTAQAKIPLLVLISLPPRSTNDAQELARVADLLVKNSQ